MSEQHQEILAGADPSEVVPPRTALVAVSAGFGVTKVFRSLGARVVGGGQTNNPSVEDIADAVRTADDDAAGAGASGGPASPRPGRIPAYPASPRPVDGPLSSPTPDIADPDYRPPDYPTGQSEPADRDRT